MKKELLFIKRQNIEEIMTFVNNNSTLTVHSIIQDIKTHEWVCMYWKTTWNKEAYERVGGIEG